jgi:small subunit ribosomal protein S21
MSALVPISWYVYTMFQGEIIMSCVYAKPGESFESLLRRFKKSVEKSGILADSRKHEFYEKPSVQKKRKRIAARKRATKKYFRADGFAKKSNVNFRFSADRTKKIPLAPAKKKPEFKKKRFNKPIKPTENKG